MWTIIWSFKLLIVISVYNMPHVATATDYKLKSISVLFRHGDAVPEKASMYPNDPHYHHDFYPFVSGGLTNAGKKREYEIGKFLRNRYNDFLGDLYYPDDVFSRSTDYDRTKMSLLLVLAGLYPPKQVQSWDPELAWQPIPITYVPAQNDSLLLPINCPSFKTEYARVLESAEYKKDLSQFKNAMVDLSKFTGLNITTSNQVLGLFNTLVAEDALNFPLPEWTKPYFPEGAITQIAVFDCKSICYNMKLTRLNGGTLLRKFLNDVTASKNGKLGPKIFLYSAHGATVSSLLQALKIWKQEVPEYGSATILEVWEKDSKYYVKVVYYKGIPPEVEDRTIHGCSKFCLLEDFKRILHDTVPDDYDKECYV